MATLTDQTSLPWPDEFPRKIRREKSWILHNGLQKSGSLKLKRPSRLKAEQSS
jgi:hypothetical protein